MGQSQEKVDSPQLASEEKKFALGRIGCFVNTFTVILFSFF